MCVYVRDGGREREREDGGRGGGRERERVLSTMVHRYFEPWRI